MTFNQLLHVQTIARIGNMTLAASALYMTQPALTKSLKALENELGIRLFDRGTQPIRLTKAGEIFLEKSEKILQMQEELMEEMKKLADEFSFKIVLGMPGETGNLLFPILLQELHVRMPDLEVHLEEADSRRLEHMLLERNVDLCFYFHPVFQPDIETEVLGQESVVFAVSRNHPLAQCMDLSQNSIWTPQLLSPELVQGQEFIVLTEGSGMRRIFNSACERHRIHPKIAMELKRNQTAVRLAAQGAGIVLTSVKAPVRLGVEREMAYFTLDNPVISREMIAAYRRDMPLSDTAVEVIRTVRDLLEKHPDLIAKVHRVVE